MGDIYVGVMTIINSIKEMSHMLVDGLCSGAQPVLGYNYGAKAYSRVRSGIKFLTTWGLGYTFVVWLLLMSIPKVFILIFNNDPELVAASIPSMRIYFSMFLFMSLQIIGQCVFVGLGKAKNAIFFSIFRKVIIVVPLVILLPMIGSLGVHGVFLSEPISDVVSAVACFSTMYFTVYRKLSAEPENEIISK